MLALPPYPCTASAPPPPFFPRCAEQAPGAAAGQQPRCSKAAGGGPQAVPRAPGLAAGPAGGLSGTPVGGDCRGVRGRWSSRQRWCVRSGGFKSSVQQQSIVRIHNREYLNNINRYETGWKVQKLKLRHAVTRVAAARMAPFLHCNVGPACSRRCLVRAPALHRPPPRPG